MRALGLRPILLWVPDVRTPEFAARAHSEALAINSSDHAEDDQAFIDAMSTDLLK